MSMRIVCFFLVCAALNGCLYTSIRVPRAYRSATPSDVKADPSDKTVTGKACFHSILFLVAWGDGGYAAAAKEALNENPSSILYDVQADRKVQSYLMGIYSRICTVLAGKAGRP